MKARDIIPGWPRGRSTSRPLAEGSVWPWQYVCNLLTGELIGVFDRSEFLGLERERPLRHILDGIPEGAAELVKDKESGQAEERRKADIMEAWYGNQRLIAGFNIPSELIETMLTSGGTGVLAPDTLRSYLASLEEPHPITIASVVPRKFGPLGCGCCPGGKHEPWFRIIPEPKP